MAFKLRHEKHDNAFGKDPATLVVEDDRGNRLDVWPALGFNAFRWTASGVDLLDCDPTFFQVLKPTRSGLPILFPFPNRIRDGQFVWHGRGYQLPLNCPTGRNAIHGFTTAAAWKPTAMVDDDRAVLTGLFEFTGNHPLWPAAGTLTVEHRLSPNVLEIHSRVESSSEILPFGLGYHPYFAVAPFGGDRAIVTLLADEAWTTVDSLPTGERTPPDPAKDLRFGKAFGSLALDDAYSKLNPRPGPNGLGWIGGMHSPDDGRRLDLFVSHDFREAVAFTPPHRRAVCLEPYTCATDAINLEAKGIDAGWITLPPRTSWEATVRLEYHG